MNNVCLLSGSNKEDRLVNIEFARDLIGERIGKLILRSGIYETEPWGFKSKSYFLNECLMVKSRLNPVQVMANILGIEELMGRSRYGKKYADRIIDIDILFFNDECIRSKDLIIPHSKLHERRFVLVPLCEIMPGFKHPVLGETIEDILAKCPDRLSVKKYQLP